MTPKNTFAGEHGVGRERHPPTKFVGLRAGGDAAGGTPPTHVCDEATRGGDGGVAVVRSEGHPSDAPR